MIFPGAVRVFEFRKKAGAPNFIRFPLFPGDFNHSRQICDSFMMIFHDNVAQ